jgi:hypothetical protein
MIKVYQRISSRSLPPYKFLPGLAPHPEKKGGHLHGHKESCEALSLTNYRSHQLFHYGIDLLNLGYFWESHVYLEIIWNAVGRYGTIADLLKGIIKIDAAGVKLLLGAEEAGLGHWKRAQELLAPLPSPFLGLDLQKYLAQTDPLSVMQNGQFNSFLSFASP